MGSNLIVGKVYKVTDNWKFSFNGVPAWREGFYKLVGFSEENHPVF